MRQLLQEKSDERKERLWRNELRDDLANEAESDVAKEVEEVPKRRTLLQAREDYKQKRLEKILKAKEKPDSPTMEELDAKPGYKEIKTRSLIQKDESIRAAATKDDYI